MFALTSIIYTLYLISVRPFKSATMNNLEIINEVGVNYFAILLFLLTPLVQSGEARY